MSPVLRPMRVEDLDVVERLEAELFGPGRWTRGM